jgi:hypothetical protein
VNERSQRAHERTVRRAREALFTSRRVICSLFIALPSRPLVGAAFVLPVSALVCIGKVLVLRRNNGSDFDWTSILSCAKAASNETPADPGAQDIGKVEFDWPVSPLLQLFASIDQILDTSRIDIAAKDRSQCGKA